MLFVGMGDGSLIETVVQISTESINITQNQQISLGNECE